MNISEFKREQETRGGILRLAQAQGCLPECQKIFDRYDRLLNQTPDPLERKQIAALAAVELHRLLNVQRGLAIYDRDPVTGEIIGGTQLIPDNPEKVRTFN